MADGDWTVGGAKPQRDGSPDGAGRGARLGGMETKWSVAGLAGRRMEANGSVAARASAVWHAGLLPAQTES